MLLFVASLTVTLSTGFKSCHNDGCKMFVEAFGATILKPEQLARSTEVLRKDVCKEDNECKKEIE